MKFAPTVAVAALALGLAAGTASAQYPAVVPHRGHYHVVPTYSPPRVSYVVPTYSPGVAIGGFYSSPGIGGYYGRPAYSGGPGYGYGYTNGHGGHHHRSHGHHGGHR